MKKINQKQNFTSLNSTASSIDPFEQMDQQDIKNKLTHIDYVLKQEKIDMDQLRKLCISKHGLVNDEIRRIVWPILLNTENLAEFKYECCNNQSMNSTEDKKDYLSLKDQTEWKTWIKNEKQHRDYDQIDKDIRRSLNSFNVCKSYSKTTKKHNREQLSQIIQAILIKNPELYYYQGLHDFVSVLYLTLGQNLGFYCADIASRFLIRDYMLQSFETGIFPLLNLMLKLLRLADEEVFEIIEQGIFGIPTFAISWVLTWFSHDIENFPQIQRAFDACLAQHPLYPIYLGVATILQFKDMLIDQFDEDDPQTSVHYTAK
eukprot:403361850